MNYQEAQNKLTGRCRLSRKLANNTYLVRVGNDLDNGDIAVRLHQTNIVTFHPDGTTTLTSGGWKTPTTKDRINRFVDFAVPSWGVFQDKAVWYIGDWMHGTRIVFYDGVRLDQRGKVIDGREETKEDRATTRKLKAKLKAYAKKYAEALPLPMPSGGDCWICCANGKDKSHIEEHIKENYLVPRLLYNALERFGASQAMKTVAFDPNKSFGQPAFVLQQIERSVFRYLKEQFGMAS